MDNHVACRESVDQKMQGPRCGGRREDYTHQMIWAFHPTLVEVTQPRIEPGPLFRDILLSIARPEEKSNKPESWYILSALITAYSANPQLDSLINVSFLTKLIIAS